MRNGHYAPIHLYRHRDRHKDRHGDRHRDRKIWSREIEKQYSMMPIVWSLLACRFTLVRFGSVRFGSDFLPL